MAGRYGRGWSKDHQIIFKLYIAGYTPGEICKETKFGIDKVRNIIRTDKFQSHHTDVVKNSVDSARKLLEGKLVEAAGQIVRIMKVGKPDQRLKFDAAKEILYQCGMKPIDVIETRGREYTPEEIKSSLTVIKEVQSIEEKLSTYGSDYLVKNTEREETPVAAPVTADTKDSLSNSEETSAKEVEQVV